MSISPEQLHILQHSLGLDRFGKGRCYRNRFVTSEETTDWPVIQSLVDLGLMEERTSCRGLVSSGDRVFSVTEQGKQAVFLQSPPLPLLSRSQRRYRAWLRADCGLSFGEWLGTKWGKA